MADIFDIPDKDPSEITLSYYRDSEDNRESGLNYYQISDNQMQFSAGYTQLNSEGFTDEIKSDKKFLMIGTNPYEDLSSTLRFEHWKADNALRIETTELKITIATDSSQISISPQSRSIELYLREAIQRDNITLSSQGLFLQYQYFTENDLSFSLSHQNHKYSKDIGAAATNPFLLFILQPATLSLASGFEKKSFAINISKLLAKGNLSFMYKVSTSALDNAKLKSYSIDWQRPVNTDMALNFSIGQSSSVESSTTSEFYNISITYYFY